MTATTRAGEDFLVHYFDLPRYKWIFVLSVGCFLTLFMIAFQPFGVTNHDPNFHISLEFVLLMSGIGFTIIVVLAASEFLLRPLLLPAPKRTGMLFWLAWDFLLVSSVVYLVYNLAGDWHDFHWSSWLEFIRDVSMVIIFPVAAFVFHIRHESLASRYYDLHTKASATPSTRLLHLSSDNEKDVLSVAAGDLLYLESQDNYLAVVYLDNGARKTALIRSTLKRIEKLVGDDLTRCHRSYMVNPQRVTACQGNQHGLKLRLDGTEHTIPVSRSYTGAMLQRLGAAGPDPASD